MTIAAKEFGFPAPSYTFGLGKCVLMTGLDETMVRKYRKRTAYTNVYAHGDSRLYGFPHHAHRNARDSAKAPTHNLRLVYRLRVTLKPRKVPTP